MRVGIPLIIVIFILVAILLFALVVHRRHKDIETEDRLAQRLDSDELCYDESPKHGWLCTRDKYHYGMHYQIVDGVKHTWHNLNG